MSASSGAKAALHRLGLIVVRRHHAAARYVQDPPRDIFDDLLLRVFPTLENLRFLQIGANDGIRADPIRQKVLDHHWSGLLVEPVPALFAALQKNYAGYAGLQFVNAAIDHQAGERPIFLLQPSLPGLPDWAHGLASFDPARVRQAAGELGLGEEAIVQQTVRTITWDALLADFGARPCDVLLVDAEGYDLPLLRAAPLGRWQPRMIHFEHACATEADRLAFYGELLALGYELASSAGDTIAWRSAPSSPPSP
jgi:FkbM family methyltransferase